MGGKTSDQKHQEDANYVDPWGMYDAGRKSDWVSFKDAGGTEDEYNALTPEERAGWNKIAGAADKDWNAAHYEEGGTLEERQAAYDSMTRDFVTNSRDHAGRNSAAPANGPDPYMTAATPNVSGPFGDTHWMKGPDGRLTQHNQLAPGLSGVKDTLQSAWADALKTPLDASKAREEAFNSAYGQATSRLDPQWQKRESAQRTQLLNQGLDEGSEAYKSAMSDMGMQRNDAYTSAQNAATAQSTAAGDSWMRNQMAARQEPGAQLATLKALAANQSPTSPLNAFIASENNKRGLKADAAQRESDNTAAAMGLVRDIYSGISG